MFKLQISPSPILLSPDAPPDGTRSAAEGPPLTTSEHAEDLTAERLQAVETLHSLGRGGDWGHVQGERLAKTAEFFLETGFFEPVGEGEAFSCYVVAHIVS